MKKTILIIGLCFIIFANGFSQTRDNYKDPKDSKFVFMTTIGVAGGIGDIEIPNRTIKNRLFAIQVNQLLAYQFNQNFFMGVNLGMDFWRYTAFIPVSLNLSVNFTKTKIAPHWYANMGYSFKWYMNQTPEKNTKVIHGANPGPFVETGLGINIKVSEKVSLLILGTYKMQHSNIKYSVSDPNEPDNSEYFTNSEKEHHYHFAGVKFGILY
ncbi:MAG: hypothetical protein MJZ72_05890 [Bacteroidales bacterium]|nr:hypothetical protein [Bacteroidales bacterium]